MNCGDFRDDLHEFLDETLDGARLAAAREHLVECAACREHLQQLRAVGDGLRAATEGISLSSEARREILSALRQAPAARTSWREAWAWFSGHPIQVLAPAAVFAIVLWFSLQLRHHSAHAHPAESMLAARQTTIDVSLSSEVHVFQVRNGMVIDTVVTEVAQSRATFSSDSSRTRGE